MSGFHISETGMRISFTPPYLWGSHVSITSFHVYSASESLSILSTSVADPGDQGHMPPKRPAKFLFSKNKF